MLNRRQEKYIEELEAQFRLREPITASGAVMTLPAAVEDLTAWVGDRRKYLSVQYEDWVQVIGDYRESLRWTGPKLAKLLKSSTDTIEAMLQLLLDPNSNSINESVRADLVCHLETLTDALIAPEPIVEAWRDLVVSVQNDKRTFEEISHRRDIVWAIAYRRDLDVDRFGIFRQVCAVLGDNDHAVQEELAKVRGTEYQLTFPPRASSGLADWERLGLCEQMLAREPARGDCIVWLRLAPTSLPQWEVRHGPVTFYNASVLAGYIAFPQRARQKMKFPPWEVLTPSGDPPILREGEVEWEDDYNMVYARVELPGIPVHAAEAKARALVEGFTVVNHANKDTWTLLNGSLLFVDGERRSLMSWGEKEDIPEPFIPHNDWMGRDIEHMTLGNRTLDARSLTDLQDAIGMSTTLKAAVGESPQATAMAAVRAIEHVNAWTTGGVKDWADFAAHVFKKDMSRIRFVQFMNSLNLSAVNNRPDYGTNTSVDADRELFQIRSKVRVSVWPGELTNMRALAGHVDDFARIYAEHWIARGLREVATMLATPEAMHRGLEEQCRRFDRQLSRLRRVRNAAIHGGPVSETACQSVASFASALGHLCLNEAIRAVLTGSDIPTHLQQYRQDHIDRFARVRDTGDIDALFVSSELDLDDGGADGATDAS